MILNLNLEGISFSLDINGWIKTTEANWDSKWCDVACDVHSAIIDYHIKSEILLSCEIDGLITMIQDIITGRQSEENSFECIEPDFTFIFHPEKNGVSSDMDLQITFWDDGALSANFLSLCFSKEDMEKLLVYLRMVTGEVSMEDQQVKLLCTKGILR